jgi:transcriptional regulator with XRE-family HTH domain
MVDGFALARKLPRWRGICRMGQESRDREGMGMATGRAERSNPQPTSLGVWLRAVRTEQGLSQRGLADQAGISRSYLCDIERGRGAKPSIETLDKLGAALGHSRNELMRAGGLIEGGLGDRHSEAERRLLAVFRDLDDAGKALVMRFTRFVHADAHSFVQAGFPMGDGEEPAPQTAQTGPTLFDLE